MNCSNKDSNELCYFLQLQFHVKKKGVNFHILYPIVGEISNTNYFSYNSILLKTIQFAEVSSNSLIEIETLIFELRI